MHRHYKYVGSLQSQKGPLRISTLAAVAAFAVACGGGDAGSSTSHSTTSGLDADGDTIKDEDEGKTTDPDADVVNTDADEYPDYLDFDSDGDGISDADEAGDADPDTPPIDSDEDGIPDFQDTDSDGDRIPDAKELVRGKVVDSDGDGTPDHLDTDSDDDGIDDFFEGAGDLDGDGIPDRLDDDTDGDCIPDALEAQADTDGDRAFDYQDNDSDGDFIADGDEDKNCNGKVDDGESSATSTDTDGDGTPDLVESVAGSDPSDPDDTIPDGDFYFVLPYQGDEATGDLDFSTNVRKADVFFSMDTTSSFEEEIDAVNAALAGTIVPGINDIIEDVAFGVGRFEDMPLDPTPEDDGQFPWGDPTDVPFELLQKVTTNIDKVTAGLEALPPAEGGQDIPEAGYEALYQWASGTGLPEFGFAPFAPAGIGGVGFRADSLPIIIHITDAISHTDEDYSPWIPTAHGRDDAVGALQAIGARVIGINSLEHQGTADDPRAQLEDLATATNALISPDEDSGKCLMGVDNAPLDPVMVGGEPECPVVFDVKKDGSGLGGLIVNAVEQLATFGALDVSTRSSGTDEGIQGESVDGGHKTNDFITAITPRDPAPRGATIDRDVFRHVIPGSTVEFELTAYNDFQRPREKDQLFEAEIEVLGDDVTVLDVHKVYIIVPKFVPSIVVK